MNKAYIYALAGQQCCKQIYTHQMHVSTINAAELNNQSHFHSNMHIAIHTRLTTSKDLDSLIEQSFCKLFEIILPHKKLPARIIEIKKFKRQI